MSDRERIGGRVPVAIEFLGLAVLAYLPYLLSNPTRIAADSKQALYLDPAGFLVRSAQLWDPQVAAGTVSHQHVGYLWPMGPWFWAFERLGLPVWVAQRLWLGSLVFLAALGARWLMRSLGFGRSAAIVGAIVYAATPYQFVFAARASVLLLPWVGLPWLVELTRRSLDRGGWRHPAIFALVAATVAGVNAPTLVLVGIGPAILLVVAAIRGPAIPVAATTFRLAALSLLTGLWWLVPLLLQARYGLDVLAVTEDLRATSSRSAPGDVLRGLGNWFFYGGDRRGPHADQAPLYDGRNLHALASFVPAAVGLAGIAVIRWRSRVAAAAFVGAAVVAVGAWPHDDPSWSGRAIRWFSDHSAVGFAFRNSARIVPVVVLGIAIGATAVVAAAPDRVRRLVGSAVVVLVLAALSPALRVGMLSEAVERPSELPSHWLDAAEYLDGRGDDTRVLELPGSNFAAHRWGNAIEPVLPHLMDRPHLAREVLPYGSPESALLLDALDRRLQHGILEPEAVAPVARLLGVGDILVRTDLDHERFGLRHPGDTLSLLTNPTAPGLGDGRSFGEPVAGGAGGSLDPLTPADLAPGPSVRSEAHPPLTVLPVLEAEPVVRVAPEEGAVVLEGDADGIVDAAAAGSIDGRSLLLLSGALDDDQVRTATETATRIVLTDSHRQRSQTWFTSIRDTRGPTEQAGETLVDPSGHDARLPSFHEDDLRGRTVVEQIGATITATSGGGAARPEDRPAAAFDGRSGTSWRVGGSDPTGERLTVTFDEPRVVEGLTLLQPQDGPRDRVVERARIHVGSAAPVDVDLDERSLEPPGQRIELDPIEADRVSIEIRATTDPGFAPELANAVGFAEVDIDGLTVDETVRLPGRLLDRIGARQADRPLDVVLTRLRTNRDEWERHDEEPVLDRTFDLPTGRRFAIDGILRVSDRATSTELERLFGTDEGAEVTASGRLQGAPDARPSRVLDGDLGTAWVSRFGEEGPITLDLVDTDPKTIEDLEVVIVADGRHSLPTRVTALVDDEPVGSGRLDRAPEGSGDVLVTIPVGLEAPLPTDHLRLRFDDLEIQSASVPEEGGAPLPIAVAEVRGTGFTPVPVEGAVDTTCRSDLLTVNGAPLPIRIEGSRTDGSFTFVGCEELGLEAGATRVRSTDRVGLDVDQLVLRSEGARDTVPPGSTIRSGGAEIERIARLRAGVDVDVRTDGRPFWFVSGQSAVDGWKITATDATVGPRTTVDGYANAWLVSPRGPGEVRITTDWGPERWVSLGFLVTALSVLACFAVIVATRHPGRPVDREPANPTVIPFRFDRTGPDLRFLPATLPLALAIAVVAALTTRWWVGLISGLVAVAVRWRPGTIWAVAVVAATALPIAHLLRAPELGWLAWAPVLAAVAADEFSRRGPRAAP